MRILPILALLVVGCGASAPDPRSAREREGALDWALLLPIETDGLVRVDLARVRRSPHRASVEPVFDDFLVEMAEPAMRQGFAELLTRTDVILVGLIPPATGVEDEVLILARGTYRPDELASLPGEGRTVTVEGHPVRIGRQGAQRTALVQLRPDTLAMTATIDRMEGLIARTRMASGPPRWPPSLRRLVAASRLEQATFGLALANRGVGGAQEGDIMAMTLAGTADVDGPLDVELLVELGDPALAAVATVFFEAMVHELSSSAVGESFALGGLAELTRIEANGTRVSGSIHAEPAAAQQLVPGLMGLLRDGFEEEPPALVSPLPTPI